MSFLDSILNEISGAKAPSATPAAPTPRSRDLRPAAKKEQTVNRDAATTDDAARQSGVPSVNGHTATTHLPKRKASGDLNDGRHKLVKKEGGDARNSRRSSASSTPPTTSKPYKGTAGLDRSKLPSRQTKPSISSTNATPAPPVPTTKLLDKSVPSTTAPTATGTQIVPKKGSYAEVLARAKAAGSKKYTGIKHKPTEKLKPAKPGHEEKSKAGEREKDKKRRLGSAEIQSGGESDRTAERKRKHTELAYKGTMRAAPTELAYKGTMHMKKPDASRVPKDDGRRGSEAARARKAEKRHSHYSDEEEEDEEEEEGGYDEESDVSDMEADVFEVDEEENKATRIAREEDRKEQEIEARLQREKKAKRDAMLKKMQAEAIARSDRRRQLG